ncbi:MAG: tetratricopeptide repeat protein [Myxococcota bacterium]
MNKTTPRVVLCAALLSLGAAGVSAADAKSDKPRIATKENAEANRRAQEEAEKARKERESRVPEVVKEAERKKETKEEQGPKLSVEEFRRKTEFQVQKKRDDQLATLDKIIGLGPSNEELPALLFQKAELSWESSQYYWFQGMGKDDDIFKARESGDAGKEKQLKKEKEELLAKSKKWADDSDKIYEEIIKKHKKFERMDQVLYALAQSRWDAGKQKEALDVYRQLIQEHPKSPYVADAYLAFGEYHFNNKKIDNALAAYQKAASNEESKVFGYAVYKQGWCYYNLTEWEKAGEKFKEVILYSQLNDQLLGDKKIVLTRESRKDYVTVYSHYGSPEKAIEEFKALADGDDYKAMVERLAGLYYSEGQDREAAVVYRLLINNDKENTRNPFFQGRIVSSASRQGNKRVVVKHARILVEEFQRVRDLVGKMDAKDPKRTRAEQDLRDAEDLADNTLRSLATTWHNEARKTRDDETFELAYELYGDYLDLFPEKKPAYDMRFFYAELNYKLERFEKAAEEYTKVLSQDPKGKWAEPSAEEAVRAYDELVQDYDKKQKKEAQSTDFDPNKPLPIPDVKKKYVAACANYLKHFPEGKIAVEVNYKIARVMYEHNIWDKALELFGKIVEKSPDHPRAEQAASLIMDIHNIREDWDGLYAAARGFQKNKVLMQKEEFAKATNEVLESSSFKVISKLQRQGKYEDAAKAYLSFADEFRKSQLADKALANAAANFALAGQPQKAIRVREMLIQNFPESPLVPDSLYAVAESHETVADLDKAAEALERFYKKYPQDPRAKDALFNAGIYREGYGGSNNLKLAVADREQYLKDFPKAKDGAAVAYSIGRLYEQAKQYKKAQEAYEAYAAKYFKEDQEKAWEARFRAADLNKFMGGQKKADEAIEKLAAEYRKKNRKLPEGSSVAARVAFMDAEVRYAEFRKIKIENPDLKNMKKFQKSIAEKAKGRDQLRKVYTDIVKLKDPEYAIAALYRIGDLNLHYMNSISSVPAPKELSPDQKEIFKEKLQERALPIEDEAVGAFRICVQKSQELNVFNQWTGRCLDVLEEKRPEEFPKVSGERVAAPAVIAPSIPNYLVLDLPKDGGDLVAVDMPEKPLPPRLTPAPPQKPQGEQQEAAAPQSGEGAGSDGAAAGGAP